MLSLLIKKLVPHTCVNCIEIIQLHFSKSLSVFLLCMLVLLNVSLLITVVPLYDSTVVTEV